MGNEPGIDRHTTRCGDRHIRPPVFSSNGWIAEAALGATTATLDGAEPLATVLSGETLRWKELAYEDRTFVFSRELEIRVTQEDGGCAYDSDDPELFGFGCTRAEAEHVFCLDFASTWDDIAGEEDGDLTKGARETKRALLSLVKSQSGAGKCQA
jgi:hypothetical protein